MPAWLFSRWTAYAAAALALWGVWTWHGHERYVQGSKDTRALYEDAAARGAADHAKEMIHAREDREAEVAGVRAWAIAHSIGPVFLRSSPTVVQVGGPADASCGTLAGDIQRVPAGDPAAGEGGSTDVGPMLQLLVDRADETSADLREQQAVK